ncbi:hypothetical protein ACA910_000816 [Epithemia clementina (nom. ined.)]
MTLFSFILLILALSDTIPQGNGLALNQRSRTRSRSWCNQPVRSSSVPFLSTKSFCRIHKQTSTALHQSRDWIDEVSEDEMLELSKGPPVKPDMKYIPRNVLRQHENFVAIREAAGKDLTNDVYVREPNNSPQVFWFVGKIARVSDVTPAQAVSRQWNIIETHATHLRPLELFPSQGSLEIWIAPGDSEMDIAYNRPDPVFEKMERDVEGADQLKSMLMGFQGEMYEAGEEGFRTWRNEDGTPAKAEIQSPSPADNGIGQQEEQKEEMRAPSEMEMVDIQKMLEGKDINEVYKEQQRRDGKAVDDEE